MSDSRVIFLDIDGVLVNRESLRNGSGRQAWGNPQCVAQLNRITDATHAHIVITSTWRCSGLADMHEVLTKWGVTGNILDITPYLAYTPGETRGLEIQAWLDKFGVERFVILDDDSDMAHLLPHLVNTTFEIGLTEADADKAIEMLTEAVREATEEK